ncbi:hypothetical protein [uncultured Gimesia sp.]|uniref:hypothetical protein n=1 Tax=uncultured Gimesia sp. TaxID=1678688 RepID=UPI0030DCEC1D|tara:strand:- start:80461 stop:80925 length:465 start_codon:yes stop_codon:yes gene_type:complete
MTQLAQNLKRLTCLFFLIPMLPFLLAGCSGNERPKTIPVTGTVTIDGKLLPKGTVTFQPKSSSEGNVKRPAIGQIDTTGRVQLSTFEAGDGVLPGSYAVVITAFENDPTAEEYAAGVKRKSLIPDKYSNALTSGLEADVAEGKNDFTFDLKSRK